MWCTPLLHLSLSLLWVGSVCTSWLVHRRKHKAKNHLFFKEYLGESPADAIAENYGLEDMMLMAERDEQLQSVLVNA